MIQALENLYFSRGDSAKVQVILSASGIQSGGTMSFSIKKTLADDAVALQKTHAVSELVTYDFAPGETKNLSAGEYFYDLRLKKTTGEIITLCLPSKLEILEVVGDVQ